MCLFPSFTFCFVVVGCRLSVVGFWFYSEISNPTKTHNPQPTTENQPLCQSRYRLDAPPRTDNQTSISISGIRL